MKGGAFKVRLARLSDIEALRLLMDASIDAILPKFYSVEAARAARQFMGLDTQLIDDGAYFVIELNGQLIGAGGWSRRATLFGGDASPGRSARLLDPETEAARIRAMYTHPDYVRLGVGARILAACEDAARAEGFRTAELGATRAGKPLYSAYGYEEIEELDAVSDDGVAVSITRMGKTLTDD